MFLHKGFSILMSKVGSLLIKTSQRYLTSYAHPSGGVKCLRSGETALPSSPLRQRQDDIAHTQSPCVATRTRFWSASNGYHATRQKRVSASCHPRREACAASRTCTCKTLAARSPAGAAPSPTGCAAFPKEWSQAPLRHFLRRWNALHLRQQLQCVAAIDRKKTATGAQQRWCGKCRY